MNSCKKQTADCTVSHHFEWGPVSKRTFHELLPYGGESYCPYSAQMEGETVEANDYDFLSSMYLYICVAVLVEVHLSASVGSCINWVWYCSVRKLRMNRHYVRHPCGPNAHPHAYSLSSLQPQGSTPSSFIFHMALHLEAVGGLISVSITVAKVLSTLSFQLFTRYWAAYTLVRDMDIWTHPHVDVSSVGQQQLLAQCPLAWWRRKVKRRKTSLVHLKKVTK